MAALSSDISGEEIVPFLARKRRQACCLPSEQLPSPQEPSHWHTYTQLILTPGIESWKRMFLTKLNFLISMSGCSSQQHLVANGSKQGHSEESNTKRQ